ncbi:MULTISPECIES: RodZ family helix-turn-helix domain-containing protein [Burkholderia cepacia complex]|uniref:helix-turn-helix domain-containing protein n=1 Tax=Burkholderia cepacia complex TaxID=87882 RepID=UPI000F567B9B|nr:MULTISPECIES: hypothetical protein [Burkholderia cepacia complex]
MSNNKPISAETARKFGAALRHARMAKEEPLALAAERSNVDVGQLSRFERGQFKRVSRNLQKYANYLQISLIVRPDALEERFRNFAARSVEHRAACELILEALERLM